MNIKIIIEIIVINMSEQQYYKLQIYLDPILIDHATRENYNKQIYKRQKQIDNNQLYIDAGFDLYTPTNNILSQNVLGQKVSMGVKCSMTFNGRPVGYYLYPRSSTGYKTPLRLSNSVGIIDPGYRGYIIALFDNISRKNKSDYVINKDDRVVQLCSPNITYPIYPELVNSEDELGYTSRGVNGFGSSGI